MASKHGDQGTIISFELELTREKLNLVDDKSCNIWLVHEVFRVNVRKICKERNNNDNKEYFILISLQLY